MPKDLKRYYGQGDLHFLTFSCYRRLALLGSVRARNLFVQALGKIRERYKFRLVGYVVMPNHVHLLISEPPKAPIGFGVRGGGADDEGGLWRGRSMGKCSMGRGYCQGNSTKDLIIRT